MWQKKKMSTMRRELATLSMKTDCVIDSSFKSLHHNQFINEVDVIKDKIRIFTGPFMLIL